MPVHLYLGTDPKGYFRKPCDVMKKKKKNLSFSFLLYYLRTVHYSFEDLIKSCYIQDITWPRGNFFYFILFYFVFLLRIHIQKKKKLQALLQNIYKVSCTRSFTYSFYNNNTKVLHAKTFQWIFLLKICHEINHGNFITQ